MTKNLLVMFLIGILISCQQVETEQAEAQENEPSPQHESLQEETHLVLDVPNEALIFDAKIGFTNFEITDEEKVDKAIEIIRRVIASPEFREKVLNFTYRGKKRFVDTKLTNEEVYQAILNGKENLKPEIDNEMDLDLQLYYSRSSTVGYTYPNQLKIYMNKRFFSTFTPSEVAGNIFHEWSHKLGFKHAFRSSRSRSSSVPYALGYLIRELGKKYE